MRNLLCRFSKKIRSLTSAGRQGFLLLYLLCNNHAFAEEFAEEFTEEKKSTQYYITPEYLALQEFSSDQIKLLSEFGPRIRAGTKFILSSNVSESGTAVWKMDTSAYLGRVEYSGQDMNQGAPVATITQYTGVTVDTIYEKDWLNTPPLQTGYIIGAKTDIWYRDIQDGSGASGYREIYQIITGKLGLHIVPQMLNHFALDIGLLYPLYTREQVPAFGVVLSPTPTTGIFARADLTGLIPLRVRGVSFALTYELLRFEQSPPSGGFIQPKTTISTFGLQFNL